MLTIYHSWSFFQVSLWAQICLFLSLKFLPSYSVQRSLIPCVFRDDLENNNQFNILLETIDVDLLSKFRPSELQEVLQDNLEVCDEGINFKYAYELMYGRFSCNMTIRLAWGPLLIICHVI